MIKRIDLRGLMCPEPVLKTKKVFEDQSIECVEALVDDDVCVNNLKRLSASLKATMTYQAHNDHFQVFISRGAADLSVAPADTTSISDVTQKDNKTGTVIFLAKDSFGEGDPEFSRTLINLFLQTVLESGQEPQAILMANSGVKLIAPDSASLKVLNDFRNRGCTVLACGLCLEYYELKDKIPKEQVTNMFSISEYLFAADKVLSP